MPPLWPELGHPYETDGTPLNGAVLARYISYAPCQERTPSAGGEGEATQTWYWNKRCTRYLSGRGNNQTPRGEPSSRCRTTSTGHISSGRDHCRYIHLIKIKCRTHKCIYTAVLVFVLNYHLRVKAVRERRRRPNQQDRKN